MYFSTGAGAAITAGAGATYSSTGDGAAYTAGAGATYSSTGASAVYTAGAGAMYSTTGAGGSVWKSLFERPIKLDYTSRFVRWQS